MECFEFDHSKHIAAARTKLQYLATPDMLLQEDDVVAKSLDESEQTFKVSNSSSSPKRCLEGHFRYEKDELGYEHVAVSPSSLLCGDFC
jgi:hypothetical protein